MGVVAAVVAIASAACNLVTGDSIVTQAVVTDGVVASPYGTATSTTDSVALQGAAGTAPCDYLGAASQAAYDRYHPSVIDLSWSGNAFTPCMRAVPYTVSDIAAKYHDDLAALTNWWTARGVRVIYSAPVCRKPGASWVNGDPAFRTMESALATAFRRQGKRVAYSEYAGRQICPNWTWYAGYRDSTDVNGLHLNGVGARVYATALRYESKHTAV